MNIADRLKELLAQPYAEITKQERLGLFRARIEQAAAGNRAYQRFVDQWPVPLQAANRCEDLPFLPVSVFKSAQPMTCVPHDEIVRTLFSSATTSQQPSRIPVNRETANLMTRGVASIISNFIGTERRQMLVVDSANANAAGQTLGARGAAIRGLLPFASKTHFAMTGASDAELELNHEVLSQCEEIAKEKDFLLYGFTVILWSKLVRRLEDSGQRLNFPRAFVLHSGGWKNMPKEVGREDFAQRAAAVLGCPPGQILDFYGMVENLGVVYPDCSQGHKHAPSFGLVLLRDPLTLEPVSLGQTGIVQVGSLLPTSFPGHLLLTEDLAELTVTENCPCGRWGPGFQFRGRIPKAELRGCGDILLRKITAR